MLQIELSEDFPETLKCRMPLRRGPNLFPQLFLAGSGFRRKSDDVRAWVFDTERTHGLGQVIARHPIGLGRDDDVWPSSGLQEFEQLAVTFLRRNVGIDESEAKRQTAAMLKVGIDEAGPLLRNLARDLCVSVAGQIGKQEFRLGLAGAPDLKKIDTARAAGSRTGAGEFLVDKRIDDARFAHIGSSKKSDFGQAGGREVRDITCREQKPGQHSHANSVGPAQASGKSCRNQILL